MVQRKKKQRVFNQTPLHVSLLSSLNAESRRGACLNLGKNPIATEI